MADAPTYQELHETVRILRRELDLQGRRVLEAEESRDTIRAHAQAGLDRYRAQDALFAKVEKLFADRVASDFLPNKSGAAGEPSHEYHRGFTECLQLLLRLREEVK
jgi:hypothetical protein